MKYLIILIFSLASIQLIAGENIDKILPSATSGKVAIKIAKGDVTINTWNKQEVRVQGKLDGEDNKFVFETMDDQLVIELEADGKGRKRHWDAGSAELTISVPSGTYLETSGMSTDFVITGIQGDVRVHSLSGDIELSNISAAINIETVSGDIDIEASQGKMKLSSVSGDIKTEGETNSLDINTVSGDVKASVGEVSMVDFDSVSGDLELTFKLAKQGEVEANTVSGDMLFMFLNEAIDARFDLETGPGGEIENRLSKVKAKESFIGSEKLSFVLGTGQGSIEIDTMSGTIELRKK